VARLSSGALHRHDLSVAVPFGVQTRVAAQGNDGLTTPSSRGACLVISGALLGAVACRAPPPTLSLSVCPPIELYRRSLYSLLTSSLDLCSTRFSSGAKRRECKHHLLYGKYRNFCAMHHGARYAPKNKLLEATQSSTAHHDKVDLV
jgi:hypothetical protein